MYQTSEVDQFLCGKLGLVRSDGGKHPKYRFPADSSICIPCALPIHLQHGRGEVNRRILRQIQAFLGLSEKAFDRAVGCKLSGRCVFILMLCAQFERLVELYELNSTFGAEGALKYSQSVLVFLHSRKLGNRPDAIWTREEMVFLEVAKGRMEPLRQSTAARQVPIVQSALDVLISVSHP